MNQPPLYISRQQLQQVFAYVQSCWPWEACGYLVGIRSEYSFQVQEFLPLQNQLQSETEYSVDPKELFLVQRQLRAKQLDILAIMHSHPSSAPIPSQKDLRNNGYGLSVIHLIVGRVSDEWNIQGWWLDETVFWEAEVIVSEHQTEGV